VKKIPSSHEYPFILRALGGCRNSMIIV